MSGVPDAENKMQLLSPKPALVEHLPAREHEKSSNQFHG